MGKPMKLRFCFWLAVGSHVTLGISLTHVIFVLNFLNCNEHIKNNFSEKKKRMQKMNLIFQYEKDTGLLFGTLCIL